MVSANECASSTNISVCTQRWQMIASRLEGSNLTPEIQAVIEEAVCLRDRGLLQESVSRLEALPLIALDKIVVRNELALTYILQHDFGKVLKMMAPLELLYDDTRDLGFTRMLLDYTVIHADMMLAEAVKSSERVYQRWLADKEVNDYDDLDLYMACLYHEIQELGRRFLNGDDWEHENFPASEALRKLRLHILDARRLEEFLLVYAAKTTLTYLSVNETIDILQDTLTLCWQGEGSMEEVSPRCLDVKAWIHLLLSQALFANEQFVELTQHLETARGIFSHTRNDRGSLWTQLYTIKFSKGGVDMGLVEVLKNIAERFEKAEDWKALQICMFQIAQIYQHHGDHAQYDSTLRLLFQSQSEIESSNFDYVSVPCVFHSNRPVHHTYYHASMFDFWKYYVLDFLAKDLQTPQHIGILIHFLSIFFVAHPDCSITSLRHLFAITLSGQYSERLYDGTQALFWAKMAFDCAENDELKAEAHHQIRTILASDDSRVVDDPYGDKQQQWNAAKPRDLAILFEEEAQSGHLLGQFDTALQLLRMQLTTEASGSPWLEKAQLILPRLPIDKRHDGKLQIDYAMAHAFFESGDYSKATTALAHLVAQCEQTPKGLEMKSRALFTLGRALMQIYRRNTDQIHWEESHTALEAALRVTLETNDIGAAACCHCMLAELWRAKGFEDQVNVNMALHHVTEVEKLWSEEQRNISSLRGLPGLLTRYAVRGSKSGPFDVFAIALNACFGNGDFEGAWMWTQKAKARAFLDSLTTNIDANLSGQATGMMFTDSNEFTKSLQEISGEQEGIVYVDWVTADDAIYMLTVREGETPRMHALSILLSSVQQWYADLCDAQDDLSGPDAEQTLSELDALCEPLAHLDIVKPKELLIFCPTKLLFNIPLHALHVDGQVLLERNPVVYTHSLSIMLRCFMEGKKEGKNKIPRPFTFFADPTGDTSGGVESITALGDSIQMETFCGIKATREQFISSCHSNRLVHYHGHIALNTVHPLDHAMIFPRHDTESIHAEKCPEIRVRNIFYWKLREYSPFINLIGCGSGQERIRSGDEPLGFPSSFIYAGASTVLATLWPIHDLDSGSAFSQLYYEAFATKVAEEDIIQPRAINLAKALQRAACEIRKREDTSAPYFWAGFVLHGMWTFEL